MTPVSLWTPENTETLKRLWGSGYSASEIAKTIGCGASRNSVIGKAHRLKLRLFKSPHDGGIQRRAAAEKQIKRVWTTDMLEALQIHAADNMTRPQIAKAMNLPVYTVSKKLMALGISTQAAADLHQQKRHNRGFTFPSAGSAPAVRRPPTLLAQEGPGPRSATLMQLGPRQCHAVVQDAPRGYMEQALMCGEPTDGRTYCAHHHFRFYRDAPPAKPRPMMAYEYTRRAA